MSAAGINAQIVDQQIDKPLIQIHYPLVAGLPNPEVQAFINWEIENLVQDLLTNPDNLHPAFEPGQTEIIIGYTVEVNRNSILSLRFEVFSLPEMAANGFTKVKSLTVNLEDGRIYAFTDLFIPGGGCVEIINEIIKQQFADRQIPMINEFESIDEDQEFYLIDDALVVYFQLFVYTPHYVGIPEFPIPYYEVADCVNPAGPIANLR